MLFQMSNKSVLLATYPCQKAFNIKFKLSPCEQSEQGGSKLNCKKNQHTPVRGCKEFVCLSVCNFSALLTMCASSNNGEMGLFRQCFQAKVKFLTKNNYPDMHRLQGGYEICHTNFASINCIEYLVYKCNIYGDNT